MRSTAPAAVAASISCSRARLVALRRTGPGGARRSHDHRTDQRRPVKSFPIGAPMQVSPTPAQSRSAEAVDQADNERHERPDCATRNEPASRAAPCRRPYRPGCRAESPDPLTRARAHGRCRPRECARLPSAHRGAPPLAAHPNGTTTTATATCTDPDAMQPPLPGQRSNTWDGARGQSRRYRPGSASPDS